MIKGVERVPIPPTVVAATAAVGWGDRALIAWRGPRFASFDLSGDVPVVRSFAWEGAGGVHRMAALGDGRWAVHALGAGVRPTERWLRVLPFDELERGGEVAPVACPRIYHDLAGLDGRLISSAYRSGDGAALIALEEGAERELLPPAGSGHHHPLLQVALPGGERGLLWRGDVYAWDGDRLEKRWALGLQGISSFQRMGRPPGLQVAPWGEDGIYYLEGQLLAQRGGRVMRVRAGGSPERVPIHWSAQGLLALPDGGLLILPKPERNVFARILFLEEGRYINLSPKGLGLTYAPGAIWWSAASRTLYTIGGGAVMRIAWDALAASRRLKLR